MACTILLADDHAIVRLGLHTLLEGQAGWVVRAEARTGREAVALAATTRPDVVILELALPELNGLEVTRRIRRVSPGTEVLIFTGYNAGQLVREVRAAGALGFVLKTDPIEQVIAAVAALADHHPFISTGVSRLLRAPLPVIEQEPPAASF